MMCISTACKYEETQRKPRELIQAAASLFLYPSSVTEEQSSDHEQKRRRIYQAEEWLFVALDYEFEVEYPEEKIWKLLKEFKLSAYSLCSFQAPISNGSQPCRRSGILQKDPRLVLHRVHFFYLCAVPLELSCSLCLLYRVLDNQQATVYRALLYR